MSRHSWLQKIYWTRFAQPTTERQLFRQLLAQPVGSVLEIGVGAGDRLRRVAQLVTLKSGNEQLRYIGVDEFEGSPAGRPHLTLKQAHQLATQLGFKASLLPGNHQMAVPRVAHKMMATDLIIIDGGIRPEAPLESFVGTWLDRLTHAESIVFGCEQSGGELVSIDHAAFATTTRIAA